MTPASPPAESSYLLFAATNISPSGQLWIRASYRVDVPAPQGELGLGGVKSGVGNVFFGIRNDGAGNVSSFIRSTLPNGGNDSAPLSNAMTPGQWHCFVAMIGLLSDSQSALLVDNVDSGVIATGSIQLPDVLDPLAIGPQIDPLLVSSTVEISALSVSPTELRCP
jgi:hypothetical protein